MRKILVITIFAVLFSPACAKSENPSSTEAVAEESSEKAKNESEKNAEEKQETSIVGTWAYMDVGIVMETTTMTFREDLTGNNSPVGDFTYTADGSKVVLTYIDSTVYTEPVDFKYRIEDDKLILTDDLKQETVYKRQ